MTAHDAGQPRVHRVFLVAHEGIYLASERAVTPPERGRRRAPDVATELHRSHTFHHGIGSQTVLPHRVTAFPPLAFVVVPIVTRIR